MCCSRSGWTNPRGSRGFLIHDLRDDDGPRRQQRAVFLDRDGVLIQDSPDYITTLEQITLLPNVATSVRQLNDAGFRVIVVTRSIRDCQRSPDGSTPRRHAQPFAGALVSRSGRRARRNLLLSFSPGWHQREIQAPFRPPVSLSPACSCKLLRNTTSISRAPSLLGTRRQMLSRARRPAVELYFYKVTLTAKSGRRRSL